MVTRWLHEFNNVRKNMTIFNFNDDEALGKVASVDTATVVVEVNDADLLKRLQVNRLVVLQSSKPGQHLIGIINQVTRKKLIPSAVEENEEPSEEQNLCKVALIGSLIDADGIKRNIFRRTLESVPEIDANCFALEGEQLTSFMRVISHAGAGKSWTTARIIEQVSELKNANAIIFDLHGEYSPLNGNGISHFKVAGPSDIESGRTLADGAIYLPYWLLSYEALVSLFVDRSDQNAPNQAMLMAREVNSAKTRYLEKGGYQDILDNFTVDSPVPFDLASFIQELNAINLERVPGARPGSDKVGEFNGKLSRMISRLENKISDRRLGFLFQGGEDVLKFDWLNRLADALLGSNDENGNGGVKIINFSEVPSDVLPLIVSLVARLAFSVQQWTPSEDRHPVAIFCDEAHLYIPNKNVSGASDDISIQIFERIAKEGRKYGVSLVVVTQRPSEVNKTILSQCSNFVAMRLTNSDDQAVIKKLLPDSLGGFSDILPTLDTGEALVVGDASLLPSRIRIDEPNNKPNSGTIEFWKEWQGDVTIGRLNKAIDNWRKQNIQ